MRLFLDSSVMIAGAASAEGASRAVFRLAEAHVWRLVTTPYAIAETVRNLAEFPPQATATWLRLRSQLSIVDDVLTIDKPAVFPVEIITKAVIANSRRLARMGKRNDRNPWFSHGSLVPR